MPHLKHRIHINHRGTEMLNLNIVNFITVSIIAILAVMAVRLGAKSLGKTSPV